MLFETISKITIFDSYLINTANLGEMALKLSINLVVMFILVRGIFYPRYLDRNYAFTNFAINIAVFLMCFLLSWVKLKLGFAFGLFAVFSILRYRTEQIPIRPMTYLFISIIIAVLNSLMNSKISYAEIALANGVIILVVYILERNLLHQHDQVTDILYEKIELIKPENKEALILDLSIRTGYRVKKAEVQSVNFLNDTAKMKIYYCEKTGTIQDETK